MPKNSPSVLSVAKAIQLLTEQASKIVAEAQDVQQSDLVGHAWLAAHDLLQNRTKPEAAVYAWRMPIYLRRVIGAISALEEHEAGLPIDPELIQPSLKAPFEDQVMDSNMRKVVGLALLSLAPRQERCVRLHYGIGHHVDIYRQQYGLNAEDEDSGLKSRVVASDFHVTLTTFSVIVSRALLSLKHPSRSRRLRACMDPTPKIRDVQPCEYPKNGLAGSKNTTIQTKIESSTRAEKSQPLHTRSPYGALGVYLGPIAPREMPKPPTAPEAVDMREMFSLFTTAGLATAGEFTFPQN